MSSFILPNQKGTEVWPQQTAIPTSTRFVDFDKKTDEVEEFMRTYGSRVRQFHQSQAQNHSLRGTQDTRNSIVFDDKYKVTYLNQMGMETITVEKRDQLKKEEGKEEEEKPRTYDNEPYVFIGMRRNVADDVDSGGHPNGYINMVVYQKDSDDLFHDYYSEYTPDETPNLKPCVELFYGPGEDKAFTLPGNKGNGAALVYGPAAIDPVDSMQWDVAFVWDPRDKKGVLEAQGLSAAKDRETMRGRGPIGPYIAKCTFRRDHCAKKSTTVSYIVILGRGATRQVKRGTFGIDHGTNIDFLLTPGGYYSTERLENNEVEFFSGPGIVGDCHTPVDDTGSNPHWKNWWQGALVINPSPLLSNRENPTSAGSIAERSSFIPAWGFSGSTNIPDYATLCDPCPAHPVRYSTIPVGDVTRAFYVYNMADLFPACFTDMGGLAGPPTRYMIYNRASFHLGSFRIKDFFSDIVGLGDPAYTTGLVGYLNSRGVTAAMIDAAIPPTVNAIGKMTYGDSGSPAVMNGETIAVPTGVSNWKWNGGSRVLDYAGRVVAADPPGCGLSKGYDWLFETTTIFEEDTYPIEFASRGYIFSDTYAVYTHLGGRADLIESPFELLVATNGPAYLKIPDGVFKTYLKFDYKTLTCTEFANEAAALAALAADQADDSIQVV